MQEKSLTRRVLVFLKDYPGASVKDVASHLGININLARAILYRLKNKGIVEKVGNGYILTKSGEYVIGKITGKEEVREEEYSAKKEQAKDASTLAEKTKKEPGKVAEIEPTSFVRKREEELDEDFINNIKNTIKSIEEKIQFLEQELNTLKKMLEKIKEITKNIRIPTQVKREELDKLPKPVMPILEAEKILGEKLRALTYTGKIVVVGSLAIDGDFYKNFISRFPISKREAEKLPDEEKILLEEMKKEGKVYLHGGKEYRLV